ncbi:hypothetical protein Bca4012_098867 [Brassica carinata]|uniref:TPX2 central domain-containing protein n=4 Tax=Brassica TaxID=3705 RepID=A0ABQ7YZ91_BRANA|nr:PREDICTED: uncharacterized protein LOC106299010 [Brassica oleracea var. oleracea]XP_013705611.2 uncharacterized protein LOC106409538 [Brassica napus]KAG2251386.1 hypothetical protein Bca52824_081522 [Brassica carinata]KAH0873234.1 hypothetical protein HID58_070596 [Brassica napus]VDD61182.1 unnamed protein product [Brassica oleracea]
MDLVSSSESFIDDLIEDYWFFENLFTRRSRALRYCHSDPYPSSSSLTCPEKMGDSDERKYLEASTVRCLIRAASVDGRERGSETKQLSENIMVQEQTPFMSFLHKKEPVVLPKSGSRSAPGKIQEPSTERSLIRAPSLPPRIDKREMDLEAKKMINKLTRQFSEKIRVLEPTTTSDRFLQKKKNLAPKKGSNTERNRRGADSSSSVKISLQRTHTMPNNIRRGEDELEDQETDSRMGFLIREALASSQNVQKVSGNQRQRPPRNLKSEATVLVKQTSPSPKTLRKTVSSIETAKEIQGYDDQVVEPRVVKGLATPPRVPKDTRKEMKDQIKFWARAVASNVRQEC